MCVMSLQERGEGRAAGDQASTASASNNEPDALGGLTTILKSTVVHKAAAVSCQSVVDVH